MYRIEVDSHFDAAHHIKDYDGKCQREHGHRWTVRLTISGSTLNQLNMLVDFTSVKASLKELLDSYLDHYQLNDTLSEPNLTAECLSNWIFNRLLKPAEFWGVNLDSVTIWESPDCSVTYSEC